VAFAAPGAVSASLVGIDRNETSAGKIMILEILAQIPRELVAGDKRRLNDGRANASVLVVVQVTAAKPHCGDVEQDLAALPLEQVERRDPGISRAMNVQGFAHLILLLHRMAEIYNCFRIVATDAFRHSQMDLPHSGGHKKHMSRLCRPVPIGPWRRIFARPPELRRQAWQEPTAKRHVLILI
jgi:hypothetical protein